MMCISDWLAWVEACRREEKEYEKRMKVLEQKRQEAKMRRIAAQRAYDEAIQKETEMRRLRTSLSRDWREFPEDMLVAVVGCGEFPVVLTKAQLSSLLGSKKMSLQEEWGRGLKQVYAVFSMQNCKYILTPVMYGQIWHWEKMYERGTYVWHRG